MKKDGQKTLEQLVIQHNAQARITFEVARQLEAQLPITSLKQVASYLDEVVIDNKRLPLKMFAAHVPDELFPINDLEDLVQKLSKGIRGAISLGRSPSFQVTNPSVLSILAATLQDDPGTRRGTPIVFSGATGKGGV